MIPGKLAGLVGRFVKSQGVKRAVLGSVAALSLASVVVFPTSRVQVAKGENVATSGGTSPRFNFLGPAPDGSNDGDAEMLRLGNVTTGDGKTWSDPISAKVGDRVAFLVYFHNGVPDTVAHNTSIRVDLPTGNVNPVKAKSWLWSEETAPISDTVVNGQIIGASGGTINLPINARIEYVPGSTKVFRYYTGHEVVTQALDGIVTTGINIGDIDGCWKYSGYVSFLADIKGQASLVLTKETALASDTTWHKEVIAQPGQEVAFRLGLINNGNATATNVTLKDQLPLDQNMLTYVPGSTKLFNTANPNGIAITNNNIVTSAGLAIPDMAPAGPGVTYVTIRAKVSAVMPPGWTTFVNTAWAYMGGVQQSQDQAIVRVFGVQTGMTIEKTIVDGANLVEQKNVKVLDVITYNIKVTNTGNVAMDNVIVRDVLPQFAVYINGSTKIGTVAAGDQIITTAGLNIGSIPVGGFKVVTLQAKVDGCPSGGSYRMLNNAYAQAQGMAQPINDTALAIVTVAAPPTPGVPH